MSVEHEQAKEANRRLYDALGARYEDTDGRRSAQLERWLKKRLAALRERAPGGALIDLATGSGFVPRCAKSIFEKRVGVDISERVLPESGQDGVTYVAADCDKLPFEDASFDVVSCFAALHHMYSYEAMFREAARVLKPGGIFYSDHDMDAAFARRFAGPLALYRKLRGAEDEYKDLGIDTSLYAQAEVHSSGVDSQAITELLQNCGFEPEPSFHWYGLNPWADKLFGERSYGRGFAPLFSCVAVKK